MNNKAIFITSDVKSVTSKKNGLQIAGYANTVNKDRMGDIIVPSAWVEGVKNYRRNPVLLLQHKQDNPIGKVNKLRVDKQGIYVEATVLDAAEDLYKTHSLIKGGALKSFSVGFKPKKVKYDRKTDSHYITDLELLEISVVAIPANQDSLFSMRKSFDTDQDYQNYMKDIIIEDIQIKAGIGSKTEGHYHTFEVDQDGNGKSTYTSHGKKHTHEVCNFEILKSDNGHSHSVSSWKDADQNIPELEIDTQDNYNVEEEIIMDISEDKNEEIISAVEEETSKEIEVKTEEVNSTKAEKIVEPDVEEKSEIVETSEEKIETEEKTIDETIEKEDEDNIEEDPHKEIPFINLLSPETSRINTGDTVILEDTRYRVKDIATYENPNFSFEEIDINGDIKGFDVVNFKAPELSVVNSWDLGSKFDLRLIKSEEEKSLTDGKRQEIKEKFISLVNATEIDLYKIKKETGDNKELQEILNKTYNLVSTNSKNWNDTSYQIANRLNNVIEALKELPETEDRNLMLKLHGHKVESTEENKKMATQNVDEPMVVDTSKDTSHSTVEVKEPRVQELLNKTEEAIKKDVDNEVIKEDYQSNKEDLTELLQQVKKYTAEVNALHNSKMVFQQQQRKDNPFTAKEMANAVFLGKALQLSDDRILDTNYGAQMKAITTVDQFLSNFSTTVYEEMEQQLVIAPMLQRIPVDARTFRVPVADEDADGDVAQFASGTFATGAYDTTRVPTSNQHTIQAVEFTPHKFMATTHLAKDEQEDTVLPLIDFLRAAASRRLARAIDKALLRGDGSLSGFNASPTNAITAGTGYAAVFKGIVTLANDIAGLRVDTGASSKATPADIASARAKLGKYGLQLGDNLVFLTTIEGYNELVQTSDFRTVDKFGPNATYLTGSLGAVYGIPVVITEFLDNASTNDDHIGCLVYKPGFMVAERRGMEIESEYNPRQQVTAIYMSTRFDMKPLTTAGTASARALNATNYSYASVVRSA